MYGDQLQLLPRCALGHQSHNLGNRGWGRTFSPCIAVNLIVEWVCRYAKTCPGFLSRDRDQADLDRLPVNGHAGFRIGRSISIAAMDLIAGAQRYLDSILKVLSYALSQRRRAREFDTSEQRTAFESGAAGHDPAEHCRQALVPVMRIENSRALIEPREPHGLRAHVEHFVKFAVPVTTPNAHAG